MKPVQVKMMIKSYLTGGTGPKRPRERIKDVELEDHLECECSCDHGQCGDQVADTVHHQNGDTCPNQEYDRHYIDLAIGLVLGKITFIYFHKLFENAFEGSCISCVLGLSLLVFYYKEKIKKSNISS